MTMEQHELDNLQQLADTTDNANGAPIVGTDGEVLPPPPPPRDYMIEAAGAVDTFAALAVGYAPKAADLWDTEAKNRITAALAPVMEKYNFSLGALPPELTLLIVAGPVLYQTSRVIASQMADQRAKAKPPAVAKPADPHAGQLGTQRPNESPELAVHPQTALYQ